MRRYLTFLCAAATGMALLTQCDDGGGDPGNRLVIGVTNGLSPGIIDELEVVRDIDGVVTTELIPIGSSAGKSNFPLEIPVEELDAAQSVGVTLRAREGGQTLITRHVQTVSQTGAKLIRVRFDNRCVTGLPGSPGPVCEEPTTTCVAGACVAALVATEAQEPYDANWPKPSSDVCKPDDGPIELVVGQGQSDYLSSAPYEIADIEAGPQGGHHIWVAIRVKNVARSGTITTVSAEIPELSLSVAPLRVIFTLDQDEGGYCKLFGLRLQVDGDGTPIIDFVNKEIRVIVEVQDPDGGTAMAEKWMTLSDTVF